MNFSDEFFVGYNSGRSEAYDEYGRRPWHEDYRDRAQHDREWDTFHYFQGKYARLFGPKRRGLGFDHGGRDRSEDPPDYHAYHLSLEKKIQPKKESKAKEKLTPNCTNKRGRDPTALETAKAALMSGKPGLRLKQCIGADHSSDC